MISTQKYHNPTVKTAQTHFLIFRTEAKYDYA